MKLSTLCIKMLLSWAGLGLFMSLTRPNSLPVIFLIVPFVLLYIAFFASWRVVVALRLRYLGRSEGSEHRRLGIALSLSGVALVVLQSLGQLTIRDVVTVLAILALGYVYLTRSKFSTGRG